MKKIIGLIVLIALLVIGGGIFVAFKLNSSPLDDFSQSESILVSQLEKMDKGDLDVTKIFAHNGFFSANTDFKNEDEISKYLNSLTPKFKVWFENLVNTHPQLSFIAGGTFRYEFRSKYVNGMFYIDKISVNFTGTYALTKQEWDTTRKRLQEIAKKIPSDSSDVQKVRLVNEYLSRYTNYDIKTYKQYMQDSKSIKDFKPFTPYDVGNGGVAVCEGYAKAANIILNELGVKTRVVTSNIQNHAWNIVQIGDKWYNLDVTWNDEDGGNYDISERYLLKSNDSLVSMSKSEHKILDEEGYDVTDTKYDNLFKGKFISSTSGIYNLEDTDAMSISATKYRLTKYNDATNKADVLINNAFGYFDDYVANINFDSNTINIYSVENPKKVIASIKNKDFRRFNNNGKNISNIIIRKIEPSDSKIVITYDKITSDNISNFYADNYAHTASAKML